MALKLRQLKALLYVLPFCTANRVTRWKYAHRETVLEPSVSSAQLFKQQKKKRENKKKISA
jgi:hypothetical protein